MTRKLSALSFVILLLIILCFLPHLLPRLDQINMWDEARYVTSGKQWVETGSLPSLARNPLTAFFYAITYLPFRHSPYWLLESCRLGRFLFVILLWGGSVLIAKRLAPLAPPLALILLLLLVPMIPRLIGNGSDALFTVMAQFAFWQTLVFWQTKNIKVLALASLFVGLAAMTRFEGILILPALLAFSCLELKSFKRSLQAWVSISLPFALIITIYLGLHSLNTGHWQTGIPAKTYQVFEGAEGIAHDLQTYGSHQTDRGQRLAPLIYGTGEKNQYSVFRAIRNNPKAFLRRMSRIASKFPFQLWQAYGYGTGLLLLLLALRGTAELFRKKAYSLLVLFLLWHLHLPAYFMTSIRSNFFYFAFFIHFSLAALGAKALAENAENKKENMLWVAVLFFCVLQGSVGGRPLRSAAALIFLLTIPIARIMMDTMQSKEARNQTVWALLVCLGFTVAAVSVRHFPYSGARKLTVPPVQDALLYLRRFFPAGTRIAVSAPGYAWMADMTPVTFSSALRFLNTEEDFVHWLSKEKIKAVYTDASFKKWESKIAGLIESQKGKRLRHGFQTVRYPRIQILHVNENRTA